MTASGGEGDRQESELSDRATRVEMSARCEEDATRFARNEGPRIVIQRWSGKAIARCVAAKGDKPSKPAHRFNEPTCQRTEQGQGEAVDQCQISNGAPCNLATTLRAGKAARWGVAIDAMCTATMTTASTGRRSHHKAS